MEWYIQTFTWYIALLILGLVFFPLTKKLFHKFYDYGYPFAKTLGILLSSYLIFAVSSFKIIPFHQVTLIIVVLLFALLNYYIFKRSRLKKGPHLYLILAEEIVFFVGFMTWAYIRSQEPSIRGLEKFMDFGFINSVVRGTSFPSKDIWLAGNSINYYYFGHVTGAFLTKLTKFPSYLSYNLILATLFGLGITQTFSIAMNLAYHAFKKNLTLSIITGVIGSFIVNLGGNLHTIYAFTKGYPNEEPVPFWTLEAKYKLTEIINPAVLLEKLPNNYWYPNATRFIQLTIHEFPLYSYVVADLHGHVFDIPFVLLTIALLFTLFVQTEKPKKETARIKLSFAGFFQAIKKVFSSDAHNFSHFHLTVLIGFMIAIHYMTNAFDAPIYLLLTLVLLFAMLRFSKKFFVYAGALLVSVFVFSLPFNLHFEPFASGIGVNCAPQFLVEYEKIGPFLFENGNCQVSPWWMLLTLWGFFWFNFVFFAARIFPKFRKITSTEYFVLMLFAFSTLLIALPEFIYAKDIYPSHFRANTMFKLGYQAFMMMGIASAFTFAYFKTEFKKKKIIGAIYLVGFIPLFLLIAIYPNFAINSFYGSGDKDPNLDGTRWILTTYPEYDEIIDYFNQEITGQPVILEAQGDSYTDYNVVSAYTGLPTVAGWWVHQWLWRGDSQVVGNIIPDIQAMYEDQDIGKTRELLQKFDVQYVVIGPNEREKYTNLDEAKFEALGQSVFTSENGKGKIIKITLDR